MRKLLHERLREAIEEAKYDEYYDGFCKYKNEKGGIRTLGEEFASELADEIEKCYIPRPRFEDGEPIQVGDAFVQKIFDEETVLQQIGIALYGNLGNMVWFPEEIVPRPEHKVKVFDADGVEIKDGDEVWSIETGKYGVVSKVGFFKTAFSIGNIMLEGVREPYFGYYFTHREPDSLEKIRDDMMAAHEDWKSDPNTLVEFADRITAIMERDQ